MPDRPSILDGYASQFEDLGELIRYENANDVMFVPVNREAYDMVVMTLGMIRLHEQKNEGELDVDLLENLDSAVRDLLCFAKR